MARTKSTLFFNYSAYLMQEIFPWNNTVISKNGMHLYINFLYTVIYFQGLCNFYSIFWSLRTLRRFFLNMGHRTTLEQRKLVIHHFKIGTTQRKISEILNLPSSTVQHIIERYSKENRIQNKGRTAPNKIFSASDKLWIERKVKENPRLSAQKIADEVVTGIGKACRASTIRRVL